MKVTEGQNLLAPIQADWAIAGQGKSWTNFRNRLLYEPSLSFVGGDYRGRKYFMKL